jgi:NTE family protein
MKNRKKIGLALGSGGFRGFAHIGVIKALQKEDIPIDYITGTSIGSLVAAYFSLYGEVDSLLDKAESLGKRNIFQFMDRSSMAGLLSQNKIAKHLDPIFSNYTFANLSIPLQIMATNLKNGKLKVFTRGNLKLAVQASCAVPLVFNPVKRAKELLVDGALCEPLPINSLYQMGADKVISVNLYHKNEFTDKRFNLAYTALRSIRILLYNYSQKKAEEADININLDISKQVIRAGLKTVFSKKLALEAMQIGERATKKHLKEIKKLL